MLLTQILFAVLAIIVVYVLDLVIFLADQIRAFLREALP